jgi:hypothetical protein
MDWKLTKRPQIIPTYSVARPSKIYPNLDFWFENKPSGNPAALPGITRKPKRLSEEFFVSRRPWFS